jgi:DNA invertase Pin-like site-specific DNA recombinase
MPADPWADETLRDLGWTDTELQELRGLQARESQLPVTAKRVLISIRLSVLTEETTSPVRQEIDLYRLAIERESRVAGVARDLGVSATKVPPWARPQLGDWINNRSPEFDEILFWKLDRFVRRVSDLHLMIEWCKEYEKTLAAKMDPIDLSTEFGQFLVTIIAGMARIEAANTGVRVESLWTFARTATRWVIGKPVYGYTTEKDENGNRQLVVDPAKARVLHWVYRMLKRGYSLYRICKILNRTDFLPPNKGEWTSGNLKVILINPALLGYRVYRGKNHKQGESPHISYDTNGDPIVLAKGIFTPEQFDEIQGILKARANKGKKQMNKRTQYLDVIKCGKCGRNWYDTTSQYTKKDKSKTVTHKLRCASYQDGGSCGMPTVRPPQKVYTMLRDAAFEELGDYEVVHREYARGSDNLAKKLDLEKRISHYMEELEPGGMYSAVGYMRDNAKETLASLGRQLSEIDPESTKDRWTYVSKGVTYRSHWEDKGDDQIEEDLRRGGITFVIHEGYAELNVPDDIKDRLVHKQDFFELKKI